MSQSCHCSWHSYVISRTSWGYYYGHRLKLPRSAWVSYRNRGPGVLLWWSHPEIWCSGLPALPASGSQNWTLASQNDWPVSRLPLPSDRRSDLAYANCIDWSIDFTRKDMKWSGSKELWQNKRALQLSVSHSLCFFLLYTCEFNVKLCS